MLKQRLKDKTAKIGIIGMGYVGLPLACEFAGSGFPVTGFEVDASKAKSLNRGVSYILDISSERVKGLVSAKKLSATTDFSRLSRMDVIIICVPTPLRKSKDPDLSFIFSAVEKTKPNLKCGQLIVLESTTFPGTTREIVLPALESTGLKGGIL